MNEYEKIEKKLLLFTRKYYINELIRGGILFLILGFLYLFFTLFLEYFLWLKPTARTILFWLFVLVEVFLLVRFICIPIFKLIGLQKGISFSDSSKIIGNHFPTVQDKLLNILQLKEKSNESDLILASIHQKSKELAPIPFLKAIDFKKNTTYLKYAFIPLIIWLITLFSGNNSIFSESLDRVVHYSRAYQPPAPFYFSLENNSLEVIQGKPFTIHVKTVGNVIPNEAKIIFDNQEYYLQNTGKASFTYTFSDVQKPVEFYIESNKIQSDFYTVQVIKTPIIKNIFLRLLYPKYLHRKNETIQNSTNLKIPQGTNIEWNVETSQTDSVSFIEQEKRSAFKMNSNGNFVFYKRVLNPTHYSIASSNAKLKDYESLHFSLDVIKDDFPSISVTSDIDSVSRGTIHFAGQISDDYGLHKLEIVYFDETNPTVKQRFSLPITKQNIQSFFYQFPDGLDLKKGIDYSFFFQVFDNDGVQGHKKTKTKIFSYREKTGKEIEEELLQEQKNTINNLENSIQRQQKQQKELEKIQEDFQQKKNLQWNDKKKVQDFIKRQEGYKKMMQKQTNKLQENFEESKVENQHLKEKKEELKKRIEELKKLDRQQKLLDEIKKVANKLNKDDLVKKAKELAQQNKQQERSLEKTLELVKRFYVEQKTMQIAEKLEELSKKQESLSKEKENNLDAQKEIKKEFNKLKEELQELDKDNEKLKKPMELPDTEDEKEDIDKELDESEKNIEKKDSSSAKKNQKKSSKKMKEMSEKMQQSMMEMEGESIEENMEDLRKILENLVTFSFKQEQLLTKFQEISTTHPDFGKDLKKQNDIKTYFEHIDDSLYVLSMRLPKISIKIQDDLSTAHYNLDQSLENFSENRFNNGLSNQRYVMTSANNLADYLSSILNNMQNSMSMKNSKGKGKGKSFSLPDLIQKQKGLSEKMQKGMKEGQQEGGKKEGEKEGGEKGNKPGEKGESGEKGGKGKSGDKGENGGEEGGKDGKGGKGSKEGKHGFNDDLDGQIYEIYKEQSQLRQQLQEALKEAGNGSQGNSQAKKALKKMEQLEVEILEKGFNNTTLQKMQQLNYELLKLDKASLEQGEDKKRKSNTNSSEFEKRKIKELYFKKLFYNQTEILNRQSLPLQENYKKKVREYFSEPKK